MQQHAEDLQLHAMTAATCVVGGAAAGLTGPLPMEMSELANLEHFYASFNTLSTPAGSTEPLAGRFCMQNATRLYSLILRANNFMGTVNMSHCEGLGLLDVQVCVLRMPCCCSCHLCCGHE
jgi:hypothetical protein